MAYLYALLISSVQLLHADDLEYPPYRVRNAMSRFCKKQPDMQIVREDGFVACKDLELYWQLVETKKFDQAEKLIIREKKPIKDAE